MYWCEKNRELKSKALQESFNFLTNHDTFVATFGTEQQSISDVCTFVINALKISHRSLFDHMFHSTIITYKNCLYESCTKSESKKIDGNNTLNSYTQCNFNDSIVKGDAIVSAKDLLLNVYASYEGKNIECPTCQRRDNILVTINVQWPRIIILNFARIVFQQHKGAQHEFRLTNRVIVPLTITLPNCDYFATASLRAVWLHVNRKSRRYASDEEDKDSYKGLTKGHYICLLLPDGIDGKCLLADDNNVYPVNFNTFTKKHARKISGAFYEQDNDHRFSSKRQSDTANLPSMPSKKYKSSTSTSTPSTSIPNQEG
jgi:hypothetical protein